MKQIALMGLMAAVVAVSVGFLCGASDGVSQSGNKDAGHLPDALLDGGSAKPTPSNDASKVEKPAAKPVYKLGSLDKNLIGNVLRKSMKDFSACFKLVAESDGRLVLKFVILESGKVGDISLEHSEGVAPKRVENCFVSVMEKIRFPRPVGGVVYITYPFLIHPSGP